jgi:hypothetical protein
MRRFALAIHETAHNGRGRRPVSGFQGARHRLLCAILACAAALSPLAAQDRDYLTPDEVQQVRDAQEPNERLALYVKFARMRIEYIDNLLSKEKPGRSVLVHDTLEDYTNIIEAIDTVADDALRRKVDITPAMKVVADAEKEMSAELEKITAKPPADMNRYEFVLNEAIDTTHDSTDLATENPSARSAEVASEQAREKKEREENLSPAELEKKKAQEAEEKKNPPRKAPSLLKPGETAVVQ